MSLCRCPNPTRDTARADRRAHCSACGGRTPTTGPPGPERVRDTCADILGLLQAVQAAYLTEYAGLWTPVTRGDSAGRIPGHTDPTGALAASRAHADKRAWAAISWDHLRRAQQQLADADAALGQIGLVDARQEPDTGPPGAWYQQGITATTPRDQIPSGRTDLLEAFDALVSRHERGEP